MEGPLDVDGIAHLASSQGTEFWLRELCMQVAALREEVINRSELARKLAAEVSNRLAAEAGRR